MWPLNLCFCLLIVNPDIKPQNILVETSAINKMFQQVPSEAFRSRDPMPDPLNDFYSESVQVSSAEEDITHATDLSVRLGDFGTGETFSPGRVAQF